MPFVVHAPAYKGSLELLLVTPGKQGLGMHQSGREGPRVCCFPEPADLFHDTADARVNAIPAVPTRCLYFIGLT